MSNLTASQSRRFLRFALGKQPFCIAASAVRELRGIEGLIPDAGPDGRVGLVPFGNDVIPVHDLATRYGGQSGEKILVIDGGQTVLAALVGHVEGIVETGSERFHLLPAVARCAETDRFSGVLIENDALALCFDARRLAEVVPASARLPHADAAAVGLGKPSPGGESGRAMVEFSMASVAEGHVWRFGLSRTQVLELTEPLPVTPLLGAPEHVAGLTLWRDRPVAVVELDRWLGVGPHPTATAKRFLVARAARHDEPIAFPVGGDVRLKTPPFEYHDGGTVRMTVPAARILGWFEHSDRTLVVPNLDTLFIPRTV